MIVEIHGDGAVAEPGLRHTRAAIGIALDGEHLRYGCGGASCHAGSAVDRGTVAVIGIDLIPLR